MMKNFLGIGLATATLLSTMETLSVAQPRISSLPKADKGDKYLAVIDREYSAGLSLDDIKEPGIISNWSRQWLRIYGYITHQSCVILWFIPICNTQHYPVKVGSVQMKIGNQIFHLQGADSLFQIEDDLAVALYNNAQKSQPVLVQVTLPGMGDKVTHRIGTNTIKAWQVIYADALNATTAEKPITSVQQSRIVAMSFCEPRSW